MPKFTFGPNEADLKKASNVNKKISATGANLDQWSPTSYTAKKALQQPTYDNKEELQNTLDEISNRPPLVFAGESRNLQAQLANAAAGNAFVLFGGDCAESFKEFRSDNIRDTYRVLLQMSVVLMYGAGVPVVKVRTKKIQMPILPLCVHSS